MNELDKINEKIDRLYDKIEKLESKRWELTKPGFKYNDQIRNKQNNKK